MKLWASVIFYRDGKEMLKNCLSSLYKNGVDEIIAVDGKYKEFPGEDWSSTSLEKGVAWEYSSYYIEAPRSGWASQMEKRNASIRGVPPGDYFLVIDADEVLANKIDKSNLKEDSYSVQMFEPKPGTESSVLNVFKNCFKQYPSNRIYKKYPDLEYRNRHCALYRTSQIKNPEDVHSGLVSRNLDIPFLYGESEPVVLYHYPHKRSAARQYEDGLYMANRTSEIEVPFQNKPLKKSSVELVRVIFKASDELKKYNCPYGSFKNGDKFYCQEMEFQRLVKTYGPFSFARVKD